MVYNFPPPQNCHTKNSWFGGKSGEKAEFPESVYREHEKSTAMRRDTDGVRWSVDKNSEAAATGSIHSIGCTLNFKELEFYSFSIMRCDDKR